MKKVISLFLCITILFTSGISVFAKDVDTKNGITVEDLLDVLEKDQETSKSEKSDSEWLEYINNNYSTDSLVLDVSSDISISENISNASDLNLIEGETLEEEDIKTIKPSEAEITATATTATTSTANDDILLDPVNAPFNITNYGNENVSLSTGGLNYEHPLLSLPGRNGLDFNLTLKYSSDSAVTNEAEFVKGRGEALKNGYSFANGWNFGFDTLLLKKKHRAASLILSSGEVYELNSVNLSTTDKAVGIKGNLLKEMSLVGNKNFYTLNFLDGTSEKFDTESGVILSRTDRFGNSIVFEYDTLEYFRGTFTEYFNIPSSFIRNVQILKSITDSAGRKINFEYSTTRKWDGIFINSIKVSTEVDGTVKKCAEIKLSTGENSFGYYTYVTEIIEYLDNSQTITTSFEYDEKTTKIYNSSLDTYSLFGECLLLNKIIYPTGGYNEYTYEKHQRALETAQYDVYKVVKSENSEGMVSVYDYEGDYSGYPYSYPSGSYDYIKDTSVEYYTTVTKYTDASCQEGSVSIYKFDHYHDLIEEISYDLDKASNRYIPMYGSVDQTLLKDGYFYRVDIDTPFITLYRIDSDGNTEFLKSYETNIPGTPKVLKINGFKNIGDDLYVFIYYSTTSYCLTSVYKYNIPEDSWIKLSGYRDTDHAPKGKVYYNGEAFYVANCSSTGSNLYIYVYSPTENTWTLGTYSHSSLTETAAYHLGNDGANAYFGVANAIIIYNFETGSFTRKAYSALANYPLKNGCVLDGKIYCTNNKLLWIYDTTAYTLSSSRGLLYKQANMLGLGPDRKIYFASHKGEIFRFNPEENAFEFVTHRMFINEDGDALWENYNLYFSVEYPGESELPNSGGYEKINIFPSDETERKVVVNEYNTTYHIPVEKTVKYYKGENVIDDFVEKWTYSAGTKRVTKYTDPEGHITSYTYDTTYYLPTKEILYDGESGKVTITYTLSADKDKTISKVETYDDRTILTEYLYEDSEGEGDTLVSYLGNVTNEKVTVTKGSESAVVKNISYVYDSTHSLLAETIIEDVSTNNESFALADSADVSTEYTYNRLGLVETQTDANGNTTSYTYNRKGWITSAEYPGGQSVDITYQIGEGNNKTTTSYNNGDYITIAYYDNLGRIARESDKADGRVGRILSEYTYDGSNLVAKESIGDNLEVYSYDGFGNLKKTISQNAFDSDGVIIYNERDDVLRTDTSITKKLVFDGTDSQETEVGRSVTTYDLMGRTIKVENGFSDDTAMESISYTYNYMGNVLTETDGDGNVTSYSYNDLGQLLSTTDAELNVTSYTYDLSGNISTVTTPGGSVTEYTYDTLNRVLSETDALDKTEYYRYDANGNVTGFKDRNGNIITTAYDVRNRPLSKSSGALSVSYTYDAFDNLLSVTDSTGTTEYSYTFDNLLESVTYPDENAMFYTYQPENNIVTKENYRGETTVSAFDSLGRERIVTEDDLDIASFSYGGTLLEKAQYENGSTVYTYDNAMRLTSLTSTLSGASGNIGQYSYEYDSRGNQTKKTEIKNGESLVTTYTYDALSRLSQVTEPDGTVTSYTFDTNGNIASKTVLHPEGYVFTQGETSLSDVTSHIVTYTYDAKNRILTETEAVEGSSDFSGTKSYTYDDNGNLTAKTTGGDYEAKTESYIYDAFGRMTEYKIGEVTKASYTYNGNGERVSKTVDGVVTKLYLENGKVINEGSSNDIEVTNYFGAGGVFKRASENTEAILYKDGHGDVVRKTVGNEVIRDYDYDAYGNEKTSSATDDNPFRYCGEYQDSETGFTYLRARYYDPSVGRFISEDTHWTPSNMIYGDKDGDTKIPEMDAIMQSSNLFAYCMNNPVRYVDSSGQISEWVLLALYSYAQAVITSPDLQYDMQMLAYDISQGDYVSAAFDVVDILAPGISGSKAVPKAIRKYFDEITQELGSPGIKAVSNVSSKRISHIINGSKGKDHLWKTVTDNVNWNTIKKFISNTIDNGTITSVKTYTTSNVTTEVYTCVKNFNGKTVEVTYNIIDGAIEVTDAWVQP